MRIKLIGLILLKPKKKNAVNFLFHLLLQKPECQTNKDRPSYGLSNAENPQEACVHR